MSWDPYKTLGIKRDAGEKDIKSAYRKLAKELHPDVRPNDKAAEAQFKKVSAAFSLLSDKEKRARFDRGEIDADGNEKAHFQGGYHPGGFGGIGAGGPFGAQGGARPGPDVFEDLFGGMFGQGGGRSRGNYGPMRGSDVRYKMNIDFVDAVNGGRKRVTMADNRSLDVNIPAGVETGQTLRLKGQGEQGMNGGPAGDALVEVTVSDHSLYRREGDNIRMDLRISLKEAVEGGKVTAPTPTGNVSLNVPAGSNSGAVLRLKGKGVQARTKAGDLLARLIVTLPDEPDEELKKFVKSWSRRDENVRD